MAAVRSGIMFLSLVIATTQGLFCPSGGRIDWIQSGGITVDEPWEKYTGANRQCCDASNPGTAFDAQVSCPMCYDLINDLPGYTLDPNNCAKFYSCAKIGGKWVAYHMNCSDCTFWNDDIKACAQVDAYCLKSVSVATDEAVTAQAENKKLFCIDFEYPSTFFVGPDGAEQPHITNEGVTIVDKATAGCPQGSKCGFFNDSRLVIEYFSNNYRFESIRISFDYKRTGAMPATQGIISNDCFNGVPDAAGNSLYCSSTNTGAAAADTIEAGLRSAPATPAASAAVTETVPSGSWSSVEIWWNGDDLRIRKDANPWSAPAHFDRLIRNSHCPLVIGSFIKDKLTSYFQGYLDNICFYKE